MIITSTWKGPCIEYHPRPNKERRRQMAAAADDVLDRENAARVEAIVGDRRPPPTRKEAVATRVVLGRRHDPNPKSGRCRHDPNPKVNRVVVDDVPIDKHLLLMMTTTTILIILFCWGMTTAARVVAIAAWPVCSSRPRIEATTVGTMTRMRRTTTMTHRKQPIPMDEMWIYGICCICLHMPDYML